jgi:ABC-2 type transport system permease protein
MNHSIITRLMLKDWYLQRKLILASLIGGIVALGIVCTGSKAGFTLGLVLLITVLVFVGAQLPIAMMVQERKDQTLSFMMSLPISFREYTISKLLGTLLIFMAPWLLFVLGSFALFLAPHGIPHGLFPLTVIMATEILVGTCFITAVALVTESQKWTVTAVMVSNFSFCAVGYYVVHLPAIAKGMANSSLMWSTTATEALLAEIAAIALLFCLTFFFQSRKRDFL